MVPLSLKTDAYRKRYGLEKLAELDLPFYIPVVGSYRKVAMAMAGLLTRQVQKF